MLKKFMFFGECGSDVFGSDFFSKNHLHLYCSALPKQKRHQKGVFFVLLFRLYTNQRIKSENSRICGVNQRESSLSAAGGR